MNKFAKKHQQNAFVILADIRSSRLITSRDLVQIGMRQLLERVNGEQDAAIRVPFTISQGDEIQGLLVNHGAVYPVIDNFDLDSELFAFRFGVGWGEVSTGFSQRSWEMDGACFHAARKALEQGKKEKRWVTIRGFGEHSDQSLNAVFRLVQVVREGWTKKQRLAVKTRKTNITQSVTAEEMGLSKSTLSKMLKSARYKELIELENAVEHLFALCLSAERTKGA